MIVLALSVTALVFYSCGGGGGGGSSSTPAGTSVTTSGIMTKGSVDINGMKFQIPAGASITVDDSPDLTENELQDGMYVHVRGSLSGDGVNGTASVVEAEDIVQGQVESVTPPGTFVVLKQTSVVDAQTVYAGGYAEFANIQLNQYVKVHGVRDADGVIHASRVQLLTGSPDSEIKGIVSNKSGSTFNIWALIVDMTNAQIEPDGETISNGDPVEVEGAYNSGTLTATKVEREDLEDSEFEVEGEDISVYGYISGFTSPSATFMVNDVTVQVTGATMYINGTVANLANNVKVEAEGLMQAGVLVAQKIEFK
ncbi:MAG: DUF5666 domain-containing protein [bacterium]